MKGETMNLKSEILKLSIVFMLVLVLIPVASAMDSDDAFIEEYNSDDEGFVIEYEDCKVEDSQDDVSDQGEHDNINSHKDYSDEDSDNQIIDHLDNHQNEAHNQNKPAYEEDTVSEHVENSFEVTPDVDDSSRTSEETICLTPEFDEKNFDINETCDNELTLEKFSVDIKGSFFIFNSDYSINNYFFNTNFNEIDSLSSLKDKNRVKILELKNNLLLNQNLTSTNDNQKISNLNHVLSININKITTNFAYSIDNSIVGSDSAAVSLTFSSFLNFDSCFDAIFSCNFLLVKYLFSNTCTSFVTVPFLYNINNVCNFFSDNY